MELTVITTPIWTARPMNTPRSVAVIRLQMLEQMEPNASYAGCFFFISFEIKSQQGIYQNMDKEKKMI